MCLLAFLDLLGLFAFVISPLFRRFYVRVYPLWVRIVTRWVRFGYTLLWGVPVLGTVVFGWSDVYNGGMSNQKHTPPPWRVEVRSNVCDDRHESARQVCLVSAGQEEPIATFHGPEAEANDLLIQELLKPLLPTGMSSAEWEDAIMLHRETYGGTRHAEDGLYAAPGDGPLDIYAVPSDDTEGS